MGVVGGAAGVAVVAVLVRRPATGAVALDEAVGQEQAALRVVELRHVAGEDEAALAQPVEDELGKRAVFLGVGGVVVVVLDAEAGQVPHMLPAHDLDEILRAHASLLSVQHGAGAVRVIGADVEAVVAAQLLKAHPDVGLDVLQQMPQVY